MPVRVFAPENPPFVNVDYNFSLGYPGCPDKYSVCDTASPYRLGFTRHLSDSLPSHPTQLTQGLCGRDGRNGVLSYFLQFCPKNVLHERGLT